MGFFKLKKILPLLGEFFQINNLNTVHAKYTRVSFQLLLFQTQFSNHI